MERHFKLHIVEFIAVIALVSIYSLIFLPFLIFIEQVTIFHIVGISITLLLGNFTYGTLRTWWKHRGNYMDAENAPDIYEYLNKLADEFGTRKPRLVVFDTEVPNAYATDTLPTRPIIAITRGLLETLSEEELKSVLAHEMSHIRSYDIFFMLFLSTFVSVIENAHKINASFVASADDAMDYVLLAIPFTITYINLMIVYTILYFVSRVREYVADKDAATFTTPEDMRQALATITIDMDELAEDKQKQFHGESALCIIPLEKFKSKYFRTHPPTKKRLERLENMKDATFNETQTNSLTESNKEQTQTQPTDEQTEENTTDTSQTPTNLSLIGNKYN